MSYLKPVLSLLNTEVLGVKFENTDLTTVIEIILGYLNTTYKNDLDLLSFASTVNTQNKKKINNHH